jgi:hypothetical protein
MDELEWLKAHSPSARPSRDTTRRHRTQLRAAIAEEGADGTRPRRPHRQRRSRHRVLVTMLGVLALCAVGAGVVALAADGGDEGSNVGAPASTDAGSTTTAAPTCPGAPPKQLAIPAGFGSAVAGSAAQATTKPSSGQQATTWSSNDVTIEQRWPADADVAKANATSRDPNDTSIGGGADAIAKIDERGVAHRTMVFDFGQQPAACTYLQVTFYSTDVGALNAAFDAFSMAPFRSSQPLVATAAAAASAPPVVACEGPVDGAKPAQTVASFVPTVGGKVSAGAFAQPSDALADFVSTRTTLARTGYQELHLADSSVVYAKDFDDKVVTTVHVVPVKAGWTVADWQASGC